mmetsp:Transcript_13445/g.28992  ORF Transcript_13445/g.28992 Transcript_13445/m.28992 type:complete len:495 (-) Transcript_13445:239-1723(-)
MVFYFTCSDPKYLIYMGRDKYENEHLIQYGWPEDLWFHVDKMSSAHVYLRLPRGDGIDDVPEEIVHECAQLTKLNSIEGCKVNNVRVVYTMWSNLRKSGDMATGQVGFHKSSQVKSVVIEKRENEIVNRLNKSKVEKHNHPSDLAELRAERDKQELEEQKRQRREHFKSVDLERERERELKATERETIYGMQNVDEEAVAAAEAETLRKISESMATRDFAEDSGGGWNGDSDLVDDLFGDLVEKPAKKELLKKKGGAEASAAPAAKGVPLTAKDLEQKVELLALDKQAEMETLTQLAHTRKAEAEAKRAREIEAKKAQKIAQRELEEQRRANAVGQHSKMLQQSQELLDGARVRIASDEAAGELAAALEENATAQEEERVVLQAIFGEEACVIGSDENSVVDGMTLPNGAVRLLVNGVNSKKAEMQVVLQLEMPAEYPSHLPPTLRIVSGVADGAERSFISSSLTVLFFEQSLGTCVVHLWEEWVREEWMAIQV